MAVGNIGLAEWINKVSYLPLFSGFYPRSRHPSVGSSLSPNTVWFMVGSTASVRDEEICSGA